MNNIAAYIVAFLGATWVVSCGVVYHWIMELQARIDYLDNELKIHQHKDLTDPDYLATLPELTESQRAKMNAVPADLVNRLWEKQDEAEAQNTKGGDE